MPVRIVSTRKDTDDPRAIDEEALQDQKDAFAAHFKLPDSTAIGNPVIRVNMKSLMAIFSQSPGYGRSQGLKILYGLDPKGGGKYDLVYAFQRLIMEEDPADGCMHIVEEGDAFDASLHLIEDLDDWRAVYQTDAVNGYYAKVRVKRGESGSAEALNPAKDACATIFPWEQEVRMLYQQNTDYGCDPIKFGLVVSCGSIGTHTEDDGGYKGYRHGLCLHLWNDVDGDLLGEGRWVTLYRLPVREEEERKAARGKKKVKKARTAGDYYRKAADLGHLCPPRCKKYVTPW